MARHKITLGDVFITVDFSPAHYTVLWFMHGIKPTHMKALKIFVDGVPCEDRQYRIEYFEHRQKVKHEN